MSPKKNLAVSNKGARKRKFESPVENVKRNIENIVNVFVEDDDLFMKIRHSYSWLNELKVAKARNEIDAKKSSVFCVPSSTKTSNSDVKLNEHESPEIRGNVFDNEILNDNKESRKIESRDELSGDNFRNKLEIAKFRDGEIDIDIGKHVEKGAKKNLIKNSKFDGKRKLENKSDSFYLRFTTTLKKKSGALKILRKQKRLSYVDCFLKPSELQRCRKLKNNFV